jgi:succinoglycan biosynthesis transport protein ExoP
MATRQPSATGQTLRPTTLADYVSILRRRKWIIIALPLVAGIVAYAIAQGGAASYRAQAVVLLNRANVVSGVTGTQDPSVFDSTRFMETQANIARSPKLAAQVAQASRVPGLTPGAVLAASGVTADADSDLLKFAVTGPIESQAVLIANAYANEFLKFKTDIDTLKVNSAIRQIRGRLRSLEAKGQEDGAAYQTLTEYLNQLLIGRFLLTDSATVLQPADYAAQTGATPTRSFLTGALLGLVLALGIAFLLEALDRQVRTEEEIEATLRLPLLGRIPEPPTKLQKQKRLVMLADPLGSHAEAFRRLRTNIEFVNVESRARTIMFTSAAPQEGKSTTIANLAVAFARAGRRVALVDLDVRLPSQHTLFGVRPDHGIAEVVRGEDTLERAMQQIVLPGIDTVVEPAENGSRPRPPNARWTPVSASRGAVSPLRRPTIGRADSESILHLLVGGRVPPAHGEFLNDERITAVLEDLGENFDLVLVDAPPLLAVGDAMALSAKVDAIVVVNHFGIRRPVLNELARQLDSCRASRLGFILTGAPQSEGYGYGYGYGRPVSHPYPDTAERTAI